MKYVSNTIKLMRPLHGEELEQAQQALIDELNEKAFKGHTPGVIKLVDEWQIACGAINMGEMEIAISIFKKHQMSFITGFGERYPVLRIFCHREKEEICHYLDLPKGK